MLKIEGTFCTKIQPTDGVPENQDENISIHSAYIYNHGKINFIEFYISTYRDIYTCPHASTRACTHTINIIIVTATANIKMTEQILVTVKDVSFQSSIERLT